MNTNGLVRFIIVGMVLLLVISVGMYFLFKPSTTSPPNEADINAIYQVVGEFGARLKNVPDSSAQSVTERIAMEGIGVNVVKGIRVFHTEDGRNIRIDKMPNGEEVVVIRELEATPLKDALEEQTGIVRSAMYSQTSAAVDSNLKRLMTDRLYNEFTTYADVVPGKPMSGPYPESIKIDSVQKLDDMSYAAKGDILLATGNQILRENAGEKPITLTLKKVNGTWLVDDVT
jgi:hypothetical protein